MNYMSRDPLYPDNPVVRRVSIPAPLGPADIPRPPLPGGPATSRPCVVTPEDQQLTGQYPWLYPPQDAQDFTQIGTIDAPIGILGVETEIFGFTVPLGWDGIIRRLQLNYIGSGFQQGSGGIIWRVLVNNRPVNFYGNVTVEVGAITDPDTLDFGIIIKSGSRVSFNVLVTDIAFLGGTRMAAGARGWFWKVARADYAPGA